MFAAAEYELVDFGDGRKLERFGDCLLDRPAPAAHDERPANPRAWSNAAARYERTGGERGAWHLRRPLPAAWPLRWGSIVLELKRTEFGHLGVFPEHACGWQWLGERVRAARRPPTVLNLFGYTGGATLAMTAAGAQVAHVDAARNVVAWARRNAAQSGLAEAPIRWIVEDARKFVRRELKRGKRYDAVVLDPPSYGHGPQGESWKLTADLGRLLADCLELTGGRPEFLLLTCHTPGFDAAELRAALSPLQASGGGRLDVVLLELVSADGRQLPCGLAARWWQAPSA